MSDFIDPKAMPPADPFEVFMAKVAGERIEVKDGNHVLVAYIYKDRLYITESYTIT